MWVFVRKSRLLVGNKQSVCFFSGLASPNLDGGVSSTTLVTDKTPGDDLTDYVSSETEKASSSAISVRFSTETELPGGEATVVADAGMTGGLTGGLTDGITGEIAGGMTGGMAVGAIGLPFFCP